MRRTPRGVLCTILLISIHQLPVRQAMIGCIYVMRVLGSMTLQTRACPPATGLIFPVPSLLESMYMPQNMRSLIASPPILTPTSPTSMQWYPPAFRRIRPGTVLPHTAPLTWWEPRCPLQRKTKSAAPLPWWRRLARCAHEQSRGLGRATGQGLCPR